MNRVVVCIVQNSLSSEEMGAVNPYDLLLEKKHGTVCDIRPKLSELKVHTVNKLSWQPWSLLSMAALKF